MTRYRVDTPADAPPRPVRGGVVASFARGGGETFEGRVYLLDDPFAPDDPGRYLRVSGAWFDVRLIGRAVGVRVLRSCRRVRIVTGGGRVMVVQAGLDGQPVSWESRPDPNERQANALARWLNHLLNSSAT